LLLLGTLGACGGDSKPDGGAETQPRCVDLPKNACTPLYSPTFDRVFTETLHRTCAQSSSCHNSEGRQGGLVFEDQAASYALLLGQSGGKARVVPGDPSCSELIVRTHSIGKTWQMPPGTALGEAELCALRQWVANGAQPASQ
jgi:hypothetical protein